MVATESRAGLRNRSRSKPGRDRRLHRRHRRVGSGVAKHSFAIGISVR